MKMDKKTPALDLAGAPTVPLQAHSSPSLWSALTLVNPGSTAIVYQYPVAAPEI